MLSARWIWANAEFQRDVTPGKGRRPGSRHVYRLLRHDVDIARPHRVNAPGQQTFRGVDLRDQIRRRGTHLHRPARANIDVAPKERGDSGGKHRQVVRRRQVNIGPRIPQPRQCDIIGGPAGLNAGAGSQSTEPPSPRTCPVLPRNPPTPGRSPARSRSHYKGPQWCPGSRYMTGCAVSTMAAPVTGSVCGTPLMTNCK